MTDDLAIHRVRARKRYLAELEAWRQQQPMEVQRRVSALMMAYESIAEAYLHETRQPRVRRVKPVAASTRRSNVERAARAMAAYEEAMQLLKEKGESL